MAAGNPLSVLYLRLYFSAKEADNEKKIWYTVCGKPRKGKEKMMMRKETDLDAVKEVLKAFLYMPVEETEYSPIVVQHPIFESGFSSVGGKIVDITTPDGLKEAVIQMEKRIDAVDRPIECMYVVRKSYYLTFLKFAKESLSLSDFSMLLGRCWTEEENPNGDVNVPVSLSARWFKAADKQALMHDEEYGVYKNLPETFMVYRGVAPGRNPDGMSWTREYDKAKWFSNRFGEGYVLEGTAHKEDVLAFFSRRGEEEVVMEAAKVEGRRKI